MKNVTMHQVYMGTVGDMKNLEQHYSDMAEKGWMIDKIGLYTHRYHAAEPCKKRFFVDFLPQITAFDYPENEDAQDYRRICEESGWNFVTANKQFHVFCADGESPAPIPIHTDNSIHAKIYLKACRKYELPWFLLGLLMFWIASPMDKGMELFLSNILLFMTIGYSCFLIGYLWTIGFVIRWYIRTKKSAKNDLPLPGVNRRMAKLRGNVFKAGTIAFLMCTITGVALEVIGGISAVIVLIILMPLMAFGVGLWIRRQIDTKRRTRAGNIGLAIVVILIMEIVLLGGMGFAARGLLNSPFHADSLDGRPALTLNEVGVTAPPDSISTHIKGTAAVPVHYEHWEINRQGSVHTEVYRSVSQSLTMGLYNHYVKEFEKMYDGVMLDITYLTPSEADFWGADEGIAIFAADDNSADMLLLRDKSLLRLRLSFSEERMSMEVAGQAVRRLWEGIQPLK